MDASDPISKRLRKEAGVVGRVETHSRSVRVRERPERTTRATETCLSELQLLAVGSMGRMPYRAMCPLHKARPIIRSWTVSCTVALTLELIITSHISCLEFLQYVGFLIYRFAAEPGS